MTGIVCSMVGASFAVAATGRVAKTITAYGNAQLDDATYVFGGTCLKFDGTGDYVQTSASNDFSFGTGDFTIEYRIKFSAVDALYVPICLRASTGIANGEWWCEVTAAEDEMYWGFKNTAGTQYYVNLSLAGSAFAINTWYHIALVRNGNSLQLYQNGTAVGSATSVTGSFGGNAAITIGALGNGSYSLNGWMDEIRISNTARYTSNFTPSTVPFNNDTNTLLLIHADGTDASTTITDDVTTSQRTANTITANGNVKISQTQFKFGGSSIYFDGTGDYLSIDYNSNLAITGGDFTIEFWYRHPQTGIDSSWGDSLIGRPNSNGGFVIRAFANKLVWVWDSVGAFDVASFDPAANTWYHVAFVRSGTGMTCYIDGVAKTVTGYVNQTDVRQATLYIGEDYVGQPDDALVYMDEIRISNTARYTSGFSVATAPFVNDANTLLLIHGTGADNATIFVDDTYA